MAIQCKSNLDRAFHALGDETRRQILARLSVDGKCTASDFVQQFDSAQPTISKHLRKLEEAGLVRRNIIGRTHYFTLGTDIFQEVNNWLHRHSKFWDANMDRLESYLDQQDGE